MKKFQVLLLYILFSSIIWGCAEDAQTETQTTLFVAPSANITVNNPLQPKGYPLILSNRSNKTITLNSITIYNNRQQKLPTTEINGVHYFWYSTESAEYYMRIRIDTKFLITKDKSLFSRGDLAARVSGQSGQICDLSNMEIELFAPNLCDEAALNLIFENSCIFGNTGWKLIEPENSTFSVLLTGADSTYDGFALSNRLKICNDGELSTTNVFRNGPYSNQALFYDSGTVDDTKLIDFCEEQPGIWNENKLSLVSNSINLSELPLEIVAYATPSGSDNKVRSEDFYLKIEHSAQNSPATILVKFMEGAEGKPTARLNLENEVSYVFSGVIADATESTSPVGDIRKPFEYKFRAETLFDSFSNLPIIDAQSSWNQDIQDLSNLWIPKDSVLLWPLLVGNYRIYLQVKDNQGLISDEVFSDFYAKPTGKLYVQLTWDNPDAKLHLYLVRYRRHGSFLVPPVEDDLINAPNGQSCSNNADCNPYFCSATTNGDLMCTYHSEASHYDTCGEYQPNPVWGEVSNPDDDPNMEATYQSGGPQAISINRPMQALYRVVVMLDPDSPRSINKSSPLHTRLSVYVNGDEYTKEMDLYFRPQDTSLPDLVVWKAVDISYSDNPEVNFVTIQNKDCYIPGQCPYANPFNAVVDAPFDPLDPDQPRSIWCDKAGDPECIE